MVVVKTSPATLVMSSSYSCRTAPNSVVELWGQRAVPPGARGTSRWRRSQSWQACNRSACITRTIARADRQTQPAVGLPAELLEGLDHRSAMARTIAHVRAARRRPSGSGGCPGLLLRRARALGADIRELGAA